MAEYNFGSIMNRDFILELKRMAEDVNVQGKTIQDLVAEGQLTDEQYANLINTVNGMLKSGEVGREDLTPELRYEVDKVRNKIDKGEVSVYDIDKNKGKFDETWMAESLLQAIAGTADIHTVPADNSITNNKMADKAIDRAKLADNFSYSGRIFGADNLNDFTSSGVYWKSSSSTPENLPDELYRTEITMEVIKSEKITQIIRPVLKPGEYWIRIFDEASPTEFELVGGEDDKEINKVLLNSTQLDTSKITVQGNYLGLAATGHTNLPESFENSNFLLKVESFSRDEGWVIQTIFETGANIQNSYKRFIRMGAAGYVEDWKKDYSLLGTGAGGGEAYDQSLNTSDSVQFASIKTDAIEVSGDLPTGTLSEPPTTLMAGDMWLDTTDSTTHPILRVMA